MPAGLCASAGRQERRRRAARNAPVSACLFMIVLPSLNVRSVAGFSVRELPLSRAGIDRERTAPRHFVKGVTRELTVSRVVWYRCRSVVTPPAFGEAPQRRVHTWRTT